MAGVAVVLMSLAKPMHLPQSEIASFSDVH